MNGSAGGTLQNVLSISTAANNRYLLHFNSLNSLTQWTAGIRLAIYEHATLHEAYTGSLIAGKGKSLNNIRTIMERSRFKTEDWARVRFGAGTPWRRCWCVVSPPDEKEYQKAQKTLRKRDTYDRKIVVPKGDIKFYDTRKVTKKTRPIATITDAYAAYAIYPQSKPLIDQSTLVKIEGLITIHGSPETTTEGFVFVMPEVHPAVTGFEMMLRFLFPVFDTFALYGRPSRLIADTLDQRGLMFAMPRDRRYGYLDILDVSGLIHTEGSSNWGERQWRRELKKLTSHRMSSGEVRGTPRRNTLTSRTSLSLNRGVRFGDESSAHSSPTTRKASPAPANDSLQFAPPRRTDTAPVSTGSPSRGHNRSASDALAYRRFQTDTPSRLSYEPTNAVEEDDEYPPAPPTHGGMLGENKRHSTLERVVSEPEEPYDNAAAQFEELKLQASSPVLAPVASPPEFSHSPGAKPPNTLYQAPDLRRANSAIDEATLHQLADATGKTSQYEREPENFRNDPREVASVANRHPRMPADASVRNEGMVNRYAGQAAQKPLLATIPASPYMNSSSSPSTRRDTTPPPVPMHRNTQNYDGSPVQHSNGPNHRLESSRSISRKPVPVHTTLPMPVPVPVHETFDPPSPSSHGSFQGDLIDHVALERMLQQSPTSVSSASNGQDEGDEDEDASVDYASIKAPSPKKFVEKPRAGRLKTVGNPDLEVKQPSRFDPFMAGPEEQPSANVPTIDFGPTLIYKPNGRPTTGGSITPGATITPGPVPRDADGAEPTGRSSSRLSMLDSRRNSYFEGRKGTNESHEQDKRRSIAWQPAAGTSATTPGEASAQGLTPEQWVQYRASLAAQPQSRPTPAYSHARQSSSNMLPMSTSKTPPPPLSRPVSGDWSRQVRRTNSKTPPLSRTQSGDWTQQGANIPSRPQSRNAGTLLNPPSPAKALQSTQQSHLSAREQTYVARATGSPLLNLSNQNKKQTDEAQQYGLIAAMAARERERAAVKEGMRSQMVEQAIQARQAEQYQVQQSAQQQYQLQQQQAYQNAIGAQQQLAYQNAAAGQQQMAANYGGRPLSQHMGSQYMGSQYGGQMAQAQVQGGNQGWGVPQQQAYGGAPYYQQEDPRQQQQRRYQGYQQ